jgi:hypothetical protein
VTAAHCCVAVRCGSSPQSTAHCWCDGDCAGLVPAPREREHEPVTMVDDPDDPPWGSDLDCPECGEGPLDLKTYWSEGGAVGLSCISHCGGSWVRGPILRGPR